MDKQYQVGEEVVIVRHGIASGLELRKVARVLKRFVELDDGTKWSFSGTKWSSSGDMVGATGYTRPSMRKMQPGDLAELSKQNLKRRIFRNAGELARAVERIRRGESIAEIKLVWLDTDIENALKRLELVLVDSR